MLIISASCPSCGYRFVDTQLLKNAEPSRWQLDISTHEDLSIRVIRSMSATVSLPELGVRIDPGPACEGFVSNVEGVLARVEKVLRGVLLGCDDADERDRIQKLLNRISEVKEGRQKVTLIVDDPTGNSAILADRAVVCPYVPEEVQDDEEI